MEQVMLLDGMKAVGGKALALFPGKKPSTGAIVGVVIGLGVLALAAHSVYRSAYPYRVGARPAGRRREYDPGDRGMDDPGEEEGEITLFTMDGCPHCDRMRKSLKSAKRQGLLHGFAVHEEDAASSEHPAAQTIDAVPSLHVRRGRSQRTYKAQQLTKRLGEWTPGNVAGLLKSGRR